MQTGLIDGAEPLPTDSDIVAALNKVDPGLGGRDMVIGVRNSAGRIYRTVTTEGLPEFLEATEVFQSFGMEDELEDSSGMREGCDAIFRVP